MKKFAVQIKNEKTNEWWDYMTFETYGPACQAVERCIKRRDFQGVRMRVWRKKEGGDSGGQKTMGIIGMALRERTSQGFGDLQTN
jgi:hypothetical protein